MIDVELTPDEIAEADEAGRWRRANGKRIGAENTDGLTGTEDELLALDIFGARCEQGGRVAVRARVWNKYDFHKPDLEDFVEVKGVRFDRHQLTISPKEIKKDLAYLLVSAERHPVYRALGWVWGGEVMEPGRLKRLREDRPPSYVIAADDPIMRPPEELAADIETRYIAQPDALVDLMPSLPVTDTAEACAAERALVGLILRAEGAAEAAIEDVDATDFLFDLHRNVFELYEAHVNEGTRPTLESVVEALGGRDVLAQGLPLGQYLAAIIAEVPTDNPIGRAHDLARSIRAFAEFERGEARAPDEGREQYRAKYGPLFWGDPRNAKFRYEWLVKGILPRGKRVLLVGPTGSGKTFLTYDLAAHVAMGVDWRGFRTKQAGVACCFYESPEGAYQRQEAFRLARDVDLKKYPFLSLLNPPQLFIDPNNGKALAEEIKALTSGWAVPLGLIIIDTHNASTEGSSEIRSEDISRIVGVHRALCDATGATLLIVGHTNDDGRHRGNKQMTNGIDTEFLVENVEDDDEKVMRDDAGRIIKRLTLRKQREGKDGMSWEFTLREVEVWKDDDNEPVTSMVIDARADVRSEEVDDAPLKARADGAFWLKGVAEVEFFKALLEAIKTKGLPSSLSDKTSANVQAVCRYHDLVEEYAKREPQGTKESDKAFDRRINTRVRDVAKTLRSFKVIATDTVEVTVQDKEGKDVAAKRFLIWPTGRKVQGKAFIWPPPPRVVEPDPVDPETEIPDVAGGARPY